MTAICYLRAMLSGRCGCRWCVFSRVVDEILEDAELRDKARAIRVVLGVYR